MMSAAFSLRSWSIVPGPTSIRPPFESTELAAIEQYPPEAVAAAILGIRATELVHREDPNWWSWTARWSSGASHIDLAMTLFDTEPLAWGGFNLSGSATPVDLLNLYGAVHAALPASWLHNSDCLLHTAESFRASIHAV